MPQFTQPEWQVRDLQTEPKGLVRRFLLQESKVMQAKRFGDGAHVGGSPAIRTYGRGLAWAILAAAGLGVTGLVVTGLAAAGGSSVGSVQDEAPPPPRGAVPQAEAQQDEPVRPGRLGIGRLRGPVMNMMQFNQQFGNAGGRSYSRSTQNGITTTVVKEQDQEIKIEETPDGIFMEIGRTYTRADVESLRSAQPELAKALESFPETADGVAVQVSVRAVQKYEAINEEDLKEEHPAAFEQYRRVQEMGNGGIGWGDANEVEGLEFSLPEIGFGPDMKQLREEMRQQQEEMRREIEKMLERIR